MADALVAIGTSVRSGQWLGRLEPRLTGSDDRATLASDVAQAQVALDSAHAEQARAETSARRSCGAGAAGRGGATGGRGGRSAAQSRRSAPDATRPDPAPAGGG